MYEGDLEGKSKGSIQGFSLWGNFSEKGLGVGPVHPTWHRQPFYPTAKGAPTVHMSDHPERKMNGETWRGTTGGLDLTL